MEAVPCMLQNPDGTPRVYGLLIRPAPNQQPVLVQQHPSSSKNASTSLQLVPTPQQIAPAPVSGSKVLLPPVSAASTTPSTTAVSSTWQDSVYSMGPAIQPKPRMQPVYMAPNQGYGQSQPRPAAPASFESRSPQAQVVPQVCMTYSSAQRTYSQPIYNNTQPATATSSNYQPLDAKNSANSNSQPLPDLAPLLDEIPQSDLVRLLVESESLLSPECPILDGAVSVESSGYSGSYQPQTPVSSVSISQTLPLNVQVSATQSQPYHQPQYPPPRMPCRYQQERRWSQPVVPRPQLEWEPAPNDSVGTPDSGVHSITGSPAAVVRTPPMLSPTYQRLQQQSAALQQVAAAQISPTSTSSSARSVGPAGASCSYETISDAEPVNIRPEERPTSSSSSATKTEAPSPPKKKRLTKRMPKRRRKDEFSDMPRLIPAYKAGVDTDSEMPELSNPSRGAKIDVRFEEVCAEVIKATEPAPAAPQTCLQPQPVASTSIPVDVDSTDPNSLVDKVLSSLKPEDIEQFTTLLQSKVKGKIELPKKKRPAAKKRPRKRPHPAEPPKDPVESAAKIEEPKKEECAPKVEESVECASKMEENVECASNASTVPATLDTPIAADDFCTANIAEDPVLQDLSQSQKMNADQTPKGPHTLSVREQKMLKKLKAYRRKARKVIDPRFLDNVSQLSTSLDSTLSLGNSPLLATSSASAFRRINWDALLQRIEDAKAISYDNLQNLEQEAESGDEEDIIPNTPGAILKEEEEEAVLEPMCSDYVEITENPTVKRISLKIKLSRILKPNGSIAGQSKSPEHSAKPSVALPPKKRIKARKPIDTPASPPLPVATPVCKPLKVMIGPRCDSHKPKRKKRTVYPWDRKSKRRKTSPEVPNMEPTPERPASSIQKCPDCTPGKHCSKCRTLKSKTKRKRPHNKDCKVVIRKLPPRNRTPLPEKNQDSPRTRTPVPEKAKPVPRTRTPVSEKDRATPNRTRTPVSEKDRATPRTRTPVSEKDRATPRIRTPVSEKDRATPRIRTPVSEKGRRTPKKLLVPKQILKTEVVNPKKKYYKAGIFSKPVSTSCDRLRKDKRAIASCHELCGEDFLLPYNLWWEMKFLASDTSRNPSTQFKKVRSSITVDQPPVRDKEARCSCMPTSGDACGKDCLNRVIFTECSPAWCPCGDLCTNRQFQRHLTSHQLERFDTESARGFGVRTTAAIKSGSFLSEYVGEIVSAERFADRMSNWYKSFPHHYALDLDSGFVIDSYRCGNTARFVNHSCQPNCEMQKWNVNGQYRMGIFALRDLSLGEELTYDYRFQAFEEGQSCLCGSPTCRGTIKTVSSPPAHPSRPASPHLRPLSYNDRIKVLKNRWFLVRNIAKLLRVAKKADKGLEATKGPDMASIVQAQLSASRRTVRTRRLTAAAEDEKVMRLSCLAQTLSQILSSILNCKSPTGEAALPRKRSAELKSISERVLSGCFESPEQFDSEVNAALKNLSRTLDTAVCNRLHAAYLEAKRSASSQLRDTLGLGLNSSWLDDPKSLNQVTKAKDDLLTTAHDMTYMNEGEPVASYDPDDVIDLWTQRADMGPEPDQDKVRCICGVFEDDGLMVQCDCCLYWLHVECVYGERKPEDDYICHFCVTSTTRAPLQEIRRHPQPDVTFQGCDYYRTLVRGTMQVRVGETVYVQRMIDKRHKALLKELHENVVRGKSSNNEEEDEDEGHLVIDTQAQEPQRTYSRKDLRIFRIERLFIAPNGRRFVFGFYYARPHETFCEPTRKFFRKEVFCTPLYDTLPLEAVVARCLVLDTSTFTRGRPKLPKYHEDDVYVNEYKLDKGQRLFDKVSKQNRSYVNTFPYIFQEFPERLKARRDFTPFIMPREHHVSEKEDGTPLCEIRDNLLKRKRKQRTQRLERVVQGLRKCDLSTFARKN